MIERTPEQLEALVLSSLTSTERVLRAIQLGLISKAFQAAENRGAWDRLTENVRGGSPLPSQADLRERGVEVVEGVEDYEGYVEELVKVSTAGRAYSILQQHVPNIVKNPMGSVKSMIGDLSDILTGVNVHVGMTDSDAPKRVELLRRQREVVDEGGVIGIPTGLAIFDDERRTWKPGELVTIIGYQGIGKSFLLAYFCCVAYMEGKKILMLTPEDSKLEMDLRVDTLLSHLDTERTGEEWGFTLTKLQLAEVDIDRYKQWCEKFALRGDWVTVDSGAQGSFSVEEVLALTREHRPDVLAINGFHMLTTSTGKSKSWETMFEAGRQIKGLTHDMEIVTLAVSQATREAGVIPDEPPEPFQVAYGHAIVEDSDRIISLGGVKGNPKRRTFKVPKFRNGPPTTHREYLEFDVDRGFIRQVKRSKQGGF